MSVVRSWSGLHSGAKSHRNAAGKHQAPQRSLPVRLDGRRPGRHRRHGRALAWSLALQMGGPPNGSVRRRAGLGAKGRHDRQLRKAPGRHPEVSAPATGAGLPVDPGVQDEPRVDSSHAGKGSDDAPEYFAHPRSPDPHEVGRRHADGFSGCLPCKRLSTRRGSRLSRRAVGRSSGPPCYRSPSSPRR